MYLPYTSTSNYLPRTLLPQTFLPGVSLKKTQAAVQQSLLQTLSKTGQAVFAYLTKGDEPKIKEVISADGHISWRVYDPVSGKTHICSTRSEVRAWLEQRYSMH